MQEAEAELEQVRQSFRDFENIYRRINVIAHQMNGLPCLTICLLIIFAAIKFNGSIP